jgi:uncharacterized RDD family membrane protein YckC
MQVITVNNQYASGLMRLAAFLIDHILISAILSLFTWHLWWGIPWGEDWNYNTWHFSLFFHRYSLLRFVIFVFYYALMESSQYQATLGKMALGIKVGDMDNQRIDFSKAMLRNISKILSSLILFIGYIMIIFDDRKQGLHDKIADTFVVKQ